ncbi:hypothetical protein J6590_082235 [Homalodisca vitripennis]|nr:hypothetical protein J6590_082235 [Homalodisca vitripennis]
MFGEATAYTGSTIIEASSTHSQLQIRKVKPSILVGASLRDLPPIEVLFTMVL